MNYLSVIFILQIFIVHSIPAPSTEPELPPSEFPKDSSKYTVKNEISEFLNESSKHLKTDDLNVPPKLFPSNNSGFKVVTASTFTTTLTTNLTKNNSMKIDTEVSDLKLHVNRSEDEQKILTELNINHPELIIPKNKNISEKKQDPDLEAEMIESDVSKTEDSKLMNLTKTKDKHSDHVHRTRGTGPMVQGHAAAIFAGIFAAVAVLCYVGLLTWRKYLEHRYGNREMLVNEEDYTNYSDIKNFEL